MNSKRQVFWLWLWFEPQDPLRIQVSADTGFHGNHSKDQEAPSSCVWEEFQGPRLGNIVTKVDYVIGGDIVPPWLQKAGNVFLTPLRGFLSEAVRTWGLHPEWDKSVSAEPTGDEGKANCIFKIDFKIVFFLTTFQQNTSYPYFFNLYYL